MVRLGLGWGLTRMHAQLRAHSGVTIEPDRTATLSVEQVLRTPDSVDGSGSHNHSWQKSTVCYVSGFASVVLLNTNQDFLLWMTVFVLHFAKQCRSLSFLNISFSDHALRLFGHACVTLATKSCPVSTYKFFTGI